MLTRFGERRAVPSEDTTLVVRNVGLRREFEFVFENSLQRARNRPDAGSVSAVRLI